MSGFHLKIMRSLSILCIVVPGVTIGLSLILVLFRYESSGYDYSATSAPSPHNYSSFRQVYTSSPGQSGQSSSHRSNFSYHSETELNPTNGSGNDSSKDLACPCKIALRKRVFASTLSDMLIRERRHNTDEHVFSFRCRQSL